MRHAQDLQRGLTFIDFVLVKSKTLFEEARGHSFALLMKTATLAGTERLYQSLLCRWRASIIIWQSGLPMPLLSLLIALDGFSEQQQSAQWDTRALA